MEISIKETEFEKNTNLNQLFQKAKAGDPLAGNAFCMAVQPLIERLCRVPYFRDKLGEDEIQSVLGLTLAKLLAEHKELPEDTQVIYLLKRILRLALIDCVRRLDFKESHEKPLSNFTDVLFDSDNHGHAIVETPSEDKMADPEYLCLHNELRGEVHKAVQQLPKEERIMIRGLFFQHKNMKEIAKNLNCTFQNAYVKRQKAYMRLNKILEPGVIA